MTQTIRDLQCYGTSDGASKGWDSRGRGKKPRFSQPNRDTVDVREGRHLICEKCGLAISPDSKNGEPGIWDKNGLPIHQSEATAKERQAHADGKSKAGEWFTKGTQPIK